MPTHFDLTTDLPEQTAVNFLAERTGLSKAKIKDAMNKGACWWILKGKQQRLRRATKVLDKNTRIQLYYDEHLLARATTEPVLLNDFGRYTAWHKPHGMLAQGSQWGDHCSLLRYVEVTTKRPVFLIHRLDADARGIMLIAHDPQAAAKLSLLFQEHKLHKEYWACVEGKFDSPEPLLINSPIEDKTARTHVSLIEYDQDHHQTQVKVVIETGRKHQIRRHLASIGHPILNDRLYGKAGKDPLQLFAKRLEFICPLTQRSIHIESTVES
ncbi:MAG: RluA family pseudouridine synthase [Cellvibrio sp.]